VEQVLSSVNISMVRHNKINYDDRDSMQSRNLWDEEYFD
jgi:hypothetical protein